jgi:DNA polymerase V
MNSNFSDHETEGRMDLNQALIKHPHSTFYLRVTGDCMTGASIYPGDLLVVERTSEAKDGDIVIACVMDELCVKRYEVRNGEVWLAAANPEYLPLKAVECGASVWGRVRYSIHAHISDDDAEESEDEWPDVVNDPDGVN